MGAWRRLAGAPPYTTRAMLLGLVFIGLAAISWGTTGATMAIVARDTAVGPLIVGWARLAVAAPCLLLLALAERGAAWSRPVTTARDLAVYAVLGLTMAAYQVCYFRAVALAGVATTALLAICSAPTIIALLARVALGERVGPVVRLSLVVAVAGAALLVVGARGLGALSEGFGVGAGLALGAGASYALYAVAAKRALARTGPVRVAAITFSLAALFLAPALAGQHVSRGDLVQSAPLLLYLGIAPTALAYVLFTAGLRRVPATAAGIATLLEPFTAATLGVVFFGETLGLLGWAGAGLLISGLLLLTAARP